MSAIPTKHIDGDVSVGRNVSTGGDANIQGRVRVGHDLVVEGWLDAPNIKGAQKGLFASYNDLCESYPRPRPGWWALVGRGFPLRLYRSFGGKWADTQTDVTSVSISGFDYIREVEEEMRTETESSINEVKEHVGQEVGRLDRLIDETAAGLEQLDGIIAETAGKADANAGEITALSAWARSLPVLDFAGAVDAVVVTPGPSRIELVAAWAAGTASVVFDCGAGCFRLRIGTETSEKFHASWQSVGSGIEALRPSSDYVAGKLFRDKSDGGRLYALRSHLWEGAEVSVLQRLGDYGWLNDRLTSMGTAISSVEAAAADAAGIAGSALEGLGGVFASLARHEENLNGLVARVAALEDGTGGSSGEVGECGCGAIASERIEALFAEEPPEPAGPLDAEPVTAAQIDDLIDDGVAQTPVDSPPGESRMEEYEIDTLIEGIFNQPTKQQTELYVNKVS